jgi:hypothetical protein
MFNTFRFILVSLAALTLFNITVSVQATAPSPSWTSYSLNDAVNGIALQGNYVWCATPNGPVRWDSRDLSSRLFVGPPDNRLNTIATASDGSIWMGSPAGVTRFDGRNWTSYIREDGLPDGNVKMIAPGTGNEMWLGMVEKYDMYNGTFYEWWISEQTGPTWTTRLHEDNIMKGGFGPLTSLAVKTGTDVWAIRSGRLLHFDGTAWKDSLSGEGMTAQPLKFVAIGQGGDLWVTGMSQVSRRHDGIWTTHDFGDAAATCMSASPGGFIGVGFVLPDSTRVIEVCAGDGVDWEAHPLGKGDEYQVNALAIGSDGVIWAGPPNGLYRLSGGERLHLIPDSHVSSIPGKLVGTDLQGDAIFVDLNGVHVFDGSHWTDNLFPTPLGSIETAAVAPNGSIWISSLNSFGLYYYNGSVWRFFVFGELGLNYPYDIFFQNDSTVQIRSGAGFSRFDGTSWIDISYPTDGLEAGGIDRMVIAPDNILWADNSNFDGGTAHVRVAHLVNDRWTTYELMTGGWESSYSLTPVVSRATGDVWAVVTGNAGDVHYPMIVTNLFRFDGVSWNQAASFAGYCESVTVGPDGAVWIGGVPFRDHSTFLYTGGGLNRYKDGVTTWYDNLAGLLDNSVSAVAVGPDGTVWVQSESGLSRFGSIIPTGVKSTQDVPREIAIKGNYPNPFNPSTSISFSLPASGKASLTVYDITGRKVRELISGVLPAGKSTAVWDGRDDSGRTVSSGVYFSRLTMGKNAVVGKMLLMK